MKRILMTLDLSACHTDDTEEPNMVVDNGFRLPYIFGVALNLLVYSYLAQRLGIKNILSRCANYLLFNELSAMLALCNLYKKAVLFEL